MNTYVNDFTTTVKKYHKSLEKYQPLSRVRESELIKRAKKNDLLARQQILESNLRFVFNVAQKFKGKGVALEDLISEGNIGLVTAIDKFDEKKDTKFITYAVWWIKLAMQECIKKNNLQREFETYTEDSVTTSKKIKSSDDEESGELVSNSFIHEQESVAKELSKEQKYILSKLLQKLSDKEQYIIKACYGIDRAPMTLEDIGDSLNISKERVRQIKEKSLRFLRTEIMLMDGISELF